MGQLRRKATIKSLKAEVYDEDARCLGSEEVLDRIGWASLRLSVKGENPPTLRLRKS